MGSKFAQVREQAAVDNMGVEAALARPLEGVVDIAVERVGGLPQGLAVADSTGVGVAAAQELVQPAGGSMAEVRPGRGKPKACCRSTEGDRRVHGYGVGGACEHTRWLLLTVMWPAKLQVQEQDELWKRAEAAKRDGQ